jgi:RNA polymerase sigma-70 factor (ECF subfamily)
MPPAPHQYHGLPAIRSFLEASFDFRGERKTYLIPCRANNQPAFGSYVADGEEPMAPTGVFVLSLAGNRISALTRFHLNDLYPRLALPESLP